MNPLTCLSRNKKENTNIQCWTFNGNWMTQKKKPFICYYTSKIEEWIKIQL